MAKADRLNHTVIARVSTALSWDVRDPQHDLWSRSSQGGSFSLGHRGSQGKQEAAGR